MTVCIGFPFRVILTYGIILRPGEGERQGRAGNDEEYRGGGRQTAGGT